MGIPEENKTEEVRKMGYVRQCRKCGFRYSPQIKEGGKLPRGYTICPNCGSKDTFVVSW